MTEIRVLLADDSRAVRRTMKLLLDSDPAIALIGEAASFQELLAMLNEVRADVVVMDVHMPGSEQVQPESVKAELATACLLAISFANDRELEEHARRFGAIRLLDKIELGSTLIPAIKDCQRRRAKGA
jgi:chemotaxis response regulator CheB